MTNELQLCSKYSTTMNDMLINVHVNETAMKHIYK